MIIRSNTLSLSSTVINLPVIGYHNVVSVSNIAASSAQTDFPDDNLANPATHLKWKSNVVTGDVNLDISSIVGTINYVGIAGHNFGTVSSTITIQNTTSGTTTLVQATAITNDQPLIFQFTESASITSLRINIADAGSDVREAAVVYVGYLLTLERSIKPMTEHTPINLGRVPDVNTGMSESGHFLGRVLRNQTQESRAEFQHFTNDHFRNYVDPFLLAARDAPFFFAFDPGEYVNDVGFAWLKSNPVPLFNPITRRFSVNIDMRGIA